MAGDWIKVEHATLNKPEVLMAAELLNVSRREALGIFLDYWAWLDVNLRESCNGSVTHVYGRLFEQALQCPGFVAVLEAIGWAKYDPGLHTLTIIHHERHNGNTAKTRALTRDRVRKSRQETRNDYVTPNALPEKRREEKILKRTSEDSGAPAPVGTGSVPIAPVGKSVPRSKTARPSGDTWTAYADAYFQRYQTEPVRNAAVNAQLAGVVKRLGAQEAPDVAAFYVTHNRKTYVEAKHPTSLLLRDCEGLRTDWARGQHTTSTQASLIDQTSERQQGWGKLIEEAKNAERDK